MWSRGFLQQAAGVLLDVDGVLLRGGSVIPAARRAIRKLVDQNNNFLFPVVFVTNAGSCQRHQKARQLSHLLDVQQVVLSHSPLRMLTSFHDKCVLVSGQGPVTHIAHTLGFQTVVTIEQLSEQFPLLDMVEHNRRPPTPVSLFLTIILFGEPIRWETNLQLLIDVLLTNGKPDCVYDTWLPNQLPVLACNMDLLWMADAPSPRFGHGMFLLCLESVYKKLTGRELQYEALLGKPSLQTYQYAEQLLRQQNHNRKLSTIYAVGDNLMTDIYGANLYKRYLAQQHAAMTPSAKLVCTGVYKPHSPMPRDQKGAFSEMVFSSHRDLKLELDLVEPDHVVEDVEADPHLMFHDTQWCPKFSFGNHRHK
uniref:Haloacid dehalogenase-like hydrolase domain-containing 5 n=1 Tax=Kryptolebias marmoratus TaxID=37003 RepID=A0A3Q3AU96_KRYMA